MAPSKKSFYAQFRSDHARREWLTPTNILLTMTAFGAMMMLFQLSLLGGSKWPEDISTYAQQTIDEQGEVYPDAVFDSKWAMPVPEEDRLHLALLHEACLTHKDSVIPFTYGKGGKVASPSTIIDRDDPDLIDKIRQCPDVDIFLPLGIRGHGYCEDSIGYTKYLQSRMLPTWAVEMTYVDKKTGKSYSYHDLCPKTPMIFLNHYWDGIPDKPEWPADKHKYMMPNVEMSELTGEHYWSVDAVLCKTAICARRVRAWYRQEGNPKNTMVFYTRHTTSDVATLARHRLGAAAIKPKDYTNVKFIHAVGTSIQKGTKHVLECWLSRKDLPKLDIYMSKDVYNGWLKDRFDKGIRTATDRLQLHFERVDANDFGKMTAENAFFMCTSFQEGYGHYINQARATAAVIVATDLPPMDELLSSESAVMVPVVRKIVHEQLLGGGYNNEHGLTGVPGMRGNIIADDICAAVDKVMAMTPAQRQALGERAKVQYDIDTNFFAAKMQEVREFAKQRRRLVRTHAPQ